MSLKEELPYSISYNSPEYENSISSLNKDERRDLGEKILILQNDPFLIAKALHVPYEGKYAVRITGKRYRLIVTINLYSKNVKLWYLSGRGNAYHR